MDNEEDLEQDFADLDEVASLPDRRGDDDEVIYEVSDEALDEFLWDYNPDAHRLLISVQRYKCDKCDKQNVECVVDFLPQNDYICRECRWRERGKYERIPQNRIAHEYGLSINDLKEACRLTPEYPSGRLTIELKPNKNEQLQDIKLYYRFQLERLCDEKHGSLAEWVSKRENRQRNKYQQYLARATAMGASSTSKRLRANSAQCSHEYIEKTEALDIGVVKHTRVCDRCGHEETWEEIV